MNEESASRRDSGEALLPLPVPDNMRTNRTKPRLLAALVAAAWIVLLPYGAFSLSRQDEKTRHSPLDSILVDRESFWGATYDNTKCIAFASAVFTPPSAETKASIALNGAVKYLLFNKNGLAQFDSRAQFSDEHQLESLQSIVKSGDAELTLRSTEAEPRQLSFAVKAAPWYREFQLPQPRGVYIVKRKERYAFYLPQQIAKAMEQYRKDYSRGAAWKQLSTEQFQACRAEVLDNSSSARSGFIDLGSYLLLVGIDEKSDIVAKLTAAEVEDDKVN